MNHDCHYLNEDLKWNKGIKNTGKYLLASICTNSYQIIQGMLLNLNQMQNEASYKHSIS